MPHSALILVIDRLGAGQLGPFGNTSVETPNFNALAAESLLLENVLADSPELQHAYRTYWTGRHVLCPKDPAGESSVVSRLAEAGVGTTLLTDEAVVAEHSLAEKFAERIHLQPDQPQACAASIEETQIAKLFSAAIDQLDRQAENSLLWVHARGMQGPWDAPLELRRSLADEEDPDPPDDVAPPSLLLADDYDPDDLLGCVQCYAGQVMLLDTCLGVLMEAVRANPRREELLVIVTSPRGFPLGEHRVVGERETRLYGELLHVPLLLWRGDGIGAAARDHVLVQPADVAATLGDWFGTDDSIHPNFGHSLLPLAESPGVNWPRDRAIAVWRAQRAIRTPAWFLRLGDEESQQADEPDSESPTHELFAKPDDRWEMNEVADRVPAVVKLLCTAIEEFEQAATTREFEIMPALPEELGE